MCIAIYVPAGKVIGKKTLKRCYEANPDGFGFAYFNNDHRLVVRKFVGNVIESEIEKFYELRQQQIDKQFIVHFRIATHGEVTTKCCHPFVVNRKLVFCHNGILGIKFTNGLSKTGNMSDTMKFNELCLQKLPKNFMDKPLYKFLLEHAIDYSKMILLNSEGKVWILNESKGEWSNGIWYSNSSYQKKTYISYYDNPPAYEWDSKLMRYKCKNTDTKSKKRYSYDSCDYYDCYDDYPYDSYGKKGWQNYGNGYGISTNGIVETKKDKEEENK